MATSKPLPSLIISGLGIPSNGLGKYGSNELTSEPLSTVVRFNRSQPPSQHPSKNAYSNLWLCGTPFLVSLLFSGSLPQDFFDDLCYKRHEPIKKTKVLHKKGPQVQRTRNLWDPKDYDVLRNKGRRVEMRITEARLRRMDIMMNTQTIKQKRNREKAEAVMLKKMGPLW